MTNVQQKLRKFKSLCQNAFDLHNTLLTEFPLPEEQKRQEEWFQSRRSVNDAFVEEACKWLKEMGASCDDENVNTVAVDVVPGDDGNDDDDDDDDDDDIKPGDSVSNVSSKRSSKGSHGSSSASSAHLKAKAENAALMEQAAALQRKHLLEEQEEKLRLERVKLRKMKEQLELNTQIAMAAARLSVLESSDVGIAASDGMNSYTSKARKGQRLELNPNANTFFPQRSTLTTSPISRGPPVSLAHGEDPYANVLSQHRVTSARDSTFRLQSQPANGTQAIAQQYQFENAPTTLITAPAGSVAAQEQQLHRLQPAQSTQPAQSIPPMQAAVDQDAICGILQRQNEITAMLVQQQMSSSLPRKDIAIFDGNPLQFLSFVRAFEHCIEEKTSSYQDCLYLLEQYTTAQPRELVRSCLPMASQEGYRRAKDLLRQHFGSEQKIATG